MFVDSYKYNIAAYQLAELLGLEDMLPVYVERKIARGNGIPQLVAAGTDG